MVGDFMNELNQKIEKERPTQRRFAVMGENTFIIMRAINSTLYNYRKKRQLKKQLYSFS